MLSASNAANPTTTPKIPPVAVHQVWVMCACMATWLCVLKQKEMLNVCVCTRVSVLY